MKLRVARHTRDLNRIIDFYGRILGLKVLGEFKDHHNYNGVFLGLPGTTWNLPPLKMSPTITRMKTTCWFFMRIRKRSLTESKISLLPIR